MFSQKTGVESSMATMVMNAVIGFMMQKGLGGMMGGAGQGQGQGGGGGIMSVLSNFMGGSDTGPDSEMVRHVQQTCGIQDSQQASQYTQQAVSVMNEQGNSDPGGLQGLLSNFVGGGAQQQSSSSGQQQPPQQKKKSFLDDVMGSLGV